jgi:thiamine monophosphate kinase
MSLEKTIEDLSIYMGAPPARMPAPAAAPEPAPMMFEPEPPILDVNAMDETTAMTADSDQLADALVDALRTPKISAARTVDHLPSHRVA